MVVPLFQICSYSIPATSIMARSSQKMRSDTSRPEAMASDDAHAPTWETWTSPGLGVLICSPAAKPKTTSFSQDPSSWFKSSSHPGNSSCPPTTISSHLWFTALLSYLLCYLAPHSTLFHSISHSIMVTTRTKNKHSHPAAPVMTKAAKEKAGIKTQAHHPRVTKDEKIWALEARLAAFENPQEESFTNEPLVCSLVVAHYVCSRRTLTAFSFCQG